VKVKGQTIMFRIRGKGLAACLFAGLLIAGCQTAPLARVTIDPPRPAATSMPDADRPIDWQPFGRVLRKYVTDDGLADYFQLVYDGALDDLRTVYGQLARTGPISHPRLYPTRGDRLAFHINAHNLLAILALAPYFGPGKADPRSIADLPGPPETSFVFTVDGEQTTLNGIRRTKIVPLLEGDPRPLLALCGGRANDPPLRGEIYSADAKKLESQLADQLVGVLRKPPWCQIDFEHQRIELPAGVADYREHYWSIWLAAAPGRSRQETEFLTVLLDLADTAGRKWLNRGIGFPVVTASPSEKLNNQRLFH
jgi:hypothetical protein